MLMNDFSRRSFLKSSASAAALMSLPIPGIGATTPTRLEWHPIPQSVQISRQTIAEGFYTLPVYARTALIGGHAFPGFPDQSLGYLERLGVNPGIIPRRSCSMISTRQGHAFAPEVITTPSTLLRMTPPLCLASVLSLSRVLRLSFSLDIETTGSQVPYPRLQKGRATSMPDAVKPTFRLPFD
ncbi:twin-arginine translocation signal domain-containing protein [Paraburkholderia fungorum]|uniref:twin-arginine translocation signal domain-containing protein n=1 Tax=Paraburkholderia fungorum TaxID=134537 RepID=UPI0038BD4AD7